MNTPRLDSVPPSLSTFIAPSTTEVQGDIGAHAAGDAEPVLVTIHRNDGRGPQQASAGVLTQPSGMVMAKSP